MKSCSLMAIAAILSSLQVASAQERLARPPKPTQTPPATACVSLGAADTGVSQLSSRIAAAQIAYLTLRADGDSASTRLRQCEFVVLSGFELLGKHGTQEAAETVAKLVLTRDMFWDFSDRSVIATLIATGAVGPLAARLLRPHRSDSQLAEAIVSCEGAKTCM